jgi:hypothetical protein
MILTESHALPHFPLPITKSKSSTKCLSSLTVMMEAVVAAAASLSDTPVSLYQLTSGDTPQVFIPCSFSN